MKKSLILTMLAVCTSLSAAVVQNSAFEKSKSGWDTRKYWGGEVTRENQTLVLKTTFARKRHWGRLVSYPLAAKFVNSEKSFKVSAEVKGKGEFYAGFLVYFKKENGKSDYRFVPGNAVALNDDFQKAECVIDLDGITPESVAPYVDVNGENNHAVIRSISVESGIEGGLPFSSLLNKKSAPAAKAEAKAAPAAKEAAANNGGVIQDFNFSKGKFGWDTRKYWGGKVARENQLLVIQTTNFKERGNWWGRALGWKLPEKIQLADKCFKITVDVKGKGEFYAGFLVISRDAKGKSVYDYVKQETPFALTDEFQKVSFTVNLTGMKPYLLEPFVEIRGENNIAYLRSVVVEHAAASGDAVTVPEKKSAAKKAAAPAKKSEAKENLKVLSSESFKKNMRNWSWRNYWGGKLYKSETDMVLEATEFKGRHWGRAIGTRPRRTEFAGRRFRLTVTAKGNGEFYPGFLVTYPKDSKKKSNYAYLKAEKPYTLDDKYRPYTFEADFSDSAPEGVTPIIDVTGKGSVVSVRLVHMEAVSGKDAEMSLISPLAVVKKGSKAPVREFKFSKADATVQTIQFDTGNAAEVAVQPEISNDKGIVKVPVQGSVNGLTKVVAAAEGAYAVSYALGVDESVFQKLDDAAKSIKPGKELSILYLGDSLNDFDRGYNSVDQAAAFLHQRHPGKFNIHNYSVGGDYIIRVEERFLGKRTDGRYKGIFDRPYDLVIISLGNNDTRATSSSNYEAPLVPAAEIKPAFERVIAILRKANPGVPVWILSASRSDSERMVQKSNAAVAAGKTGIRFGIAKHAENFNKAVQETVAAGKDLRYIDIYTPMCEKFSPENYADGVHLSLKGHHLFAELLLKAFAK